MRNSTGLLVLLVISCCCCWTSITAKPLLSVGLGVQIQRPYSYLPGESYYNNYHNNYYYANDGAYYGGAYRYPSGYPYVHPYPYTSNYGAALDIGIGALSLTPFLL